MKNRSIQIETLNTFFVEVFNKILLTEETVLSNTFPNLSLKEIHIIEAVEILSKTNKNTMSSIAKYIGITVGALTTAINVLITKNYLIRQREDIDRRIVWIHLTPNGDNVAKEHAQFHKEMIEGVLETINDNELKALVFSLEQLTVFFNQSLKQISKNK